MAALLEAARRRNPLPAGTAAVGAGLIVAGLSAYGFLFFADKALSKAEYSPLGALWSLVFLVGPGLFLPLEQEISRALAERRARNQGGAPVVRRAATIGAGLFLAVMVLLILSAPLDRRASLRRPDPAARRPGAGSGRAPWPATSPGAACRAPGASRATAPTSAPTASSGCSGRCCCCLIGVNTAGPFGMAVGIAGLIAVPIALMVQKPDLEEGPEASFSEVGSALGMLLIASLSAFALMNIGPVLVKLLASDSQAEAAGSFVNAVVIARIPLFLFQAVQASLLPKLSTLAHSGHLGDFRIGLRRLLVAVAGLAAVGTVVGAVLGPFVVEIMFDTADIGARTMGLLAAGAGIYMLAMACAQAVIALGGHGDQAIGWGAGIAALFLTVLAGASLDLFLRVELGLLVGSAVALVVIGGLLLRRLHQSGPLTIDSGDLIEAIHEVPIEP